MNEVEAQKQFIKKRRQHFLTQERWEEKQIRLKKSSSIWEEHWNSGDAVGKHIFRFRAEDMWDKLRINYTAGEPIDTLPPLLDEIINVFEITTVNWQQHKEELKKEGYYCGPLPWFEIDDYLKVMGIISVCYLLHREDLLERLLNIILANSEGELEPDCTIEDLFYYRFKDREDPDYAQFGDHAVLLSNAIRDDDKTKQLTYLNTYLKKWYKEMASLNDTEYQSHIEPEQNNFYGYWSFEAAAVAYLDDLDDTEFYQYPYYPKDMVEWAREQRRLRYAAQDSESLQPLLRTAGQTAPLTGKYGVDNFSGFESYFKAGETLPAGQVSGKRDEQGNPILRQDTVWRLLSREDGGSTRFSPSELQKYSDNS